MHERNSDTQITAHDLALTVKRFGCPISTILLNTPCETFSISSVDGAIGYQVVHNCAVVIGDPLCVDKDIPELTEAFHNYCKENGWRIVYFLASDSFANWAILNRCHTLIEVGEKLVLDPSNFHVKQKLRWKINQSIQHGVEVKEYDKDPTLEAEIKQAIELWTSSRKGTQIYLGTLDPFTNNQRIFYATQEKKIVGFVSLAWLDSVQGWVVTSFLGIPDGPVGVTEHLMSTVFTTLANENCHYICLGAIAGSKLGKIEGLNYFSEQCARFIFKIAQLFFHFESKKNLF